MYGESPAADGGIGDFILETLGGVQLFLSDLSDRRMMLKKFVIIVGSRPVYRMALVVSPYIDINIDCGRRSWNQSL